MRKDKIHSAADITLEASLLKALAVKRNYDQFINVLDTKRLIPQTAFLLKDYKLYYDKYNNDIDWDVFYTDFAHSWHKRDLDERDLAYYRETVFPLIRNSQIGNHLFISLLEKEASDKLAQISDTGFDTGKVRDVLAELENKSAKYRQKGDDDVFKFGVADMSIIDPSNGLEWFLPSLQAGLNSIMPGQFIIVAADSGVGKSAFCITQAVTTFRQINKASSDRPILYCTSEDTEQELEARVLSNLYKDKLIGGFEEVIEQYPKVSGHFKANYNPDLFIAMQIKGPSCVYKIEDKIAKYNPSLVVVDMLDKMSPSLAITDLTALYDRFRGLANDGYPIIGTSQAGNTKYTDKEGMTKSVKWLSDKNLAGSKSGKQGAAYCMIMIGADDDVPNVRYVGTTKKKRGKHVRTTCLLDERYSLYKEMI